MNVVFIELKGAHADKLLLGLAAVLAERDGARALRLLQSTAEDDLYLLTLDLAADETLPPLPPGARVWTFQPLVGRMCLPSSQR